MPRRFVDESNPDRVIDVFVDALDLAEMSFEGVEPAATGRHAMRLRRETIEPPFGTMKARMGATHFLTKTLPKVRPRWPSHSLPII